MRAPSLPHAAEFCPTTRKKTKAQFNAVVNQSDKSGPGGGII
jgi:hypothetical protein